MFYDGTNPEHYRLGFIGCLMLNEELNMVTPYTAASKAIDEMLRRLHTLRGLLRRAAPYCEMASRSSVRDAQAATLYEEILNVLREPHDA